MSTISQESSIYGHFSVYNRRQFVYRRQFADKRKFLHIPLWYLSPVVVIQGNLLHEKTIGRMVKLWGADYM